MREKEYKITFKIRHGEALRNRDLKRMCNVLEGIGWDIRVKPVPTWGPARSPGDQLIWRGLKDRALVKNKYDIRHHLILAWRAFLAYLRNRP